MIRTALQLSALVDALLVGRGCTGQGSMPEEDGQVINTEDDAPDPCERAICEALDEMASANLEPEQYRDGVWTRAVKERLVALGHGEGCRVYTGGYLGDADREGGGEWLFDMTWIRGDGGFLERLPLVLESEWNFDPLEISNDFQKLLVARAEHRVMIFQAKTADEHEKRIGEMREEIRRCTLSEDDDRYLLSCWIDDGGGRAFKHRSMVVRA